MRAGQQLHSSSHLVVVGAVNPGGEVLSDGDITVYGPLRGRALAGLGASHATRSTATILATDFDAELVAIGPLFLPLERRPEGVRPGRLVKVTLGGDKGDQMDIAVLGDAVTGRPADDEAREGD